jgi:hypothetical protein
MVLARRASRRSVDPLNRYFIVNLSESAFSGGSAAGILPPGEYRLMTCRERVPIDADAFYHPFFQVLAVLDSWHMYSLAALTQEAEFVSDQCL